jgi:hypothetical protein
MSLTGAELEGYGGTLRDSGMGIYVGDETDFRDLLFFWNLRAAGATVEFLPLSHVEQFQPFISEHLVRLCEIPRAPAPGTDSLSAYCLHSKYDRAKQLAESVRCSKPVVALPCDDDVRWNGFNLEIKNPFFAQHQRLADVERLYDRYHLSFNLPEPPLFAGIREQIARESFVVSIDPINEGGDYPNQTLKPPLLRDMNGFYGSSLLQNAFRVKSEENGVRVITEPREHSLSLVPIPHQALIERLFALANMKAKLSQAGVITRQVLNKLGSVEGARVFKISGVRKLLNSLKKDTSITRTQATKIIHESNFANFEDLYIEPRVTPKLTPTHSMDFLLKKEFLRAGLDLVCDYCRLESWLPLRQIDDYWVCEYCGGRNQTSLHLKSRGDWKFRKSGLFAKDNNQEGAVPVALTLLQLHRRLSNFGYVYSPSLTLDIDSKHREIDLCVLQYGIGHRIEVGVAECKSAGGSITEEDVHNLRLVRAKLHAVGLSPILIFSKTAESFNPEEIALFEQLASDDVHCILLLNKELEAHEPYERYERTQLVDQYPSMLEAMAWNSRKIYLGKE